MTPEPTDPPTLDLQSRTPNTGADSTSVGGSVAIITGAAGGIGSAVASALAGSGPLALLDHDTEALNAVTKRLDAVGPVRAYSVDISDSRAVQAVVDQVEQELGPIGRLAHVAGVLRPGRVIDATDADWNTTFAVNTAGLFHVARAVARTMIIRRRGAIVTIGSNSGHVPRIGLAAYAASKAAATHFTRCLGLELAEYGIRCNIVSPGSTDTAMQQTAWGDAAASAISGDPAGYRVGIPLGRIADPDDIADAAAFLLSERARHITLQDLLVDGGATL